MMRTPIALPGLLGMLGIAACVSTAGAQCGPQWLEGEGVPGVAGHVYAVRMWDPDGPGPRNTQLVIGGDFALAGLVPASNIVMWDTVTGSLTPLGSGTSGPVYSLAVLDGDELVAGGTFDTADGVSVGNIARFNGSYWSSLDVGVSRASGTPRVYAVTVLQNGDLIAAGGFSDAGGIPSANIARWNGTSWSAMGPGFNSVVQAVTQLPNGDLFAGGNFSFSGATSARSIASWNGNGWSALGAGTNGVVYSLSASSDGRLMVGGHFSSAGSFAANNVALWDGSAWSAMGSGINASWVSAFALSPAGNPYAGTPTNVYQWDGKGWRELRANSTNGHGESLVFLPNGELVAGGSSLRCWNGERWAPVVPGMNRSLLALAVLPNGDFFAGGPQVPTGDGTSNRIALRQGNAWLPLGSGISGSQDGGFGPTVSALALLGDGSLVVGGTYTMAGGKVANGIAKWDGQLWSPLGSGAGGLHGQVYALLATPDKRLVAGGFFTVTGNSTATDLARWDGKGWSALGSGVGGGVVYALAGMPNGDLIVGGSLATAGGSPANNIARWNGQAWSALGSGLSGGEVLAIAILPNSDIVAGGSFDHSGQTQAINIARWNGKTWFPLGAGLTAGSGNKVGSLAVLPNGDVVAGGHFVLAGSNSVESLARWDGAAWTPIAPIVPDADTTQLICSAMALLPEGDLLASGRSGAYYWARYTFTNVPWIAVQPEHANANCGGTVSFFVTPASGYDISSYRWRRNGMELSDGPTGTGSTISGAHSATLVISNVSAADAAQSGEGYDCVIANDCGSDASTIVSLAVSTCCPADFDSDGFITGLDFDLFVLAFESGDIAADFDGNGFVNGADFDEFVLAYEAGC